MICRDPPPPPPRPPASLNWIFLWTPQILKILILQPILSLKVTKFFVKISQFEFLVMTEKNIFVYKLSLSLNISDFSSFFNVKIATPREKCHPLFPSKSPLKLMSFQAPYFWKFGRWFNLLPSRKGKCTLCSWGSADGWLIAISTCLTNFWYSGAFYLMGNFYLR